MPQAARQDSATRIAKEMEEVADVCYRAQDDAGEYMWANAVATIPAHA